MATEASLFDPEKAAVFKLVSETAQLAGDSKIRLEQCWAAGSLWEKGILNW